MKEVDVYITLTGCIVGNIRFLELDRSKHQDAKSLENSSTCSSCVSITDLIRQDLSALKLQLFYRALYDLAENSRKAIKTFSLVGHVA